MAPIAQAKGKNELVKKWLGTDLFHQRGITLELSSKGYENSALLEYQSRMHSEISKIARTHVYGGLIKDTEREERGDYSQVLPLPKKHLVLCDTSDAFPVAVRPESSRINVYHALCSVAITRQALSTLPGDGTQQGRQRIGIVTPYKKQSRLLQSLINDADLKEQVRVGTVHKFQGLEFDIVIFDTVESPDIPPRKDFIAGGKATEALRLINVAVTRARHKLIIVANAQHILSAQSDQSLWFPEESILRKAVEEARQAGTINSLDLLNLSIQAPNRASGDLSHSSVEVQFPLASRLGQSEYEHLDDRTFFDRLIRDMKLAQKKIVIFSPFFGPQRLEHIKPILVERHKSGVEVMVFSSNIKQEPYYTWAIEELKQGGIKHQTFYGRHDKHAIIDTEIVYIGSLRRLSRLPTLLLLQEVVNGLVTGAAEAMTTRGRRPQLVRWTWQRDATYRFQYREQTMRLFADGVVALCIRTKHASVVLLDQWFGLFLLFTDLDDERLMRLRLERLLCWRESPERWSTYQHMLLVLILARSPRQCDHWQRASESAALKLRLDPPSGALACLPQPEDRQINPWRLAWRTLSTDVPYHLQHLLRPLPSTALPPSLPLEEDEDEAREARATSHASAASASPGTPVRLKRLIVGDLTGRAAGLVQESREEPEVMALRSLRLTPRQWASYACCWHTHCSPMTNWGPF